MIPASDPGRLVLLRHGQTEWSASGQHTSRTDIPLTDRGRVLAQETADLGRRILRGRPPALVLTSPRARAQVTAELVGLHVDRVDDRLVEWDYGEYEGRTTSEIRTEQPGWSIWERGAPGGETPGTGHEARRRPHRRRRGARSPTATSSWSGTGTSAGR